MRRLMMAIAGLTLLGGCPELETADPGGSEPAALTVEPNLIDFGGLVPGQLQTREIRITNSGGQPARFSGTALTGTGSFSVADAALDEELLPGLTATVEVSYAPPGYEVAEATLALITRKTMTTKR